MSETTAERLLRYLVERLAESFTDECPTCWCANPDDEWDGDDEHEVGCGWEAARAYLGLKQRYGSSTLDDDGQGDER